MYRLAEGGGEWKTVKSGLTDGICLVDHLAPGQVGSNTKLREGIDSRLLPSYIIKLYDKHFLLLRFTASGCSRAG